MNVGAQGRSLTAVGADARRERAFRYGMRAASPQLLGVAALMGAICLSPRFPFAVAIPGRAFDLRAEDVVLVVLLPFWLRGWRRLNGVLAAIPRVFALYLGLALVSTLFGVLVVGVSPIRGAAYWGKGVEELLICLMVATWLQNGRDRRLAIWWLGLLALANLLWFAVQLVIHKKSALLVPPAPENVFQRARELESYGPGLIGEVSPLATGAFMLAFFLLAFAVYLLVRRRLAVASLAAATTFLCATVISQSRVSIFGAVLGAAAMVFSLRIWRRALVGLAVAGLIAGSSAYFEVQSIQRLTDWQRMADSIDFRLQHSWEPIIAKLNPTPRPTPQAGATTVAPPTAAPRATPAPTAPALPSPSVSSLPQAGATPGPAPASGLRNPDFTGRRMIVFLFGLGNGAMGTPGLLPVEAHDHYLRVFLESGFLGLGVFGWLLLTTLLFLWRAARRPTVTADRAVVLATLGLLLAFMAAALVQDMFLPVIPNELLWLLVGLSAATGLGVLRLPAAVSTIEPGE